MLICPICLAKPDYRLCTLKNLLEMMQSPKKMNNCTNCDGRGYKEKAEDLKEV